MATMLLFFKDLADTINVRYAKKGRERSGTQ